MCWRKKGRGGNRSIRKMNDIGEEGRG